MSVFLTKDMVVNEIMKITGGSQKKEFTKTELARFLGASNPKALDPVLEELVREGFLRVSRVQNNAKYYALAVPKTDQPMQQQLEASNIGMKQFIISVINDPTFRSALKSIVREALEEYFKGKDVTISDFLRVYETAMDDTCMASIHDIRTMLGLSLEDFMAKFRDYILQNFQLISGGKEGIIKDGVLYGLIRRKDYVSNCPKKRW
jgi:hypothetical protein